MQMITATQRQWAITVQKNFASPHLRSMLEPQQKKFN